MAQEPDARKMTLERDIVAWERRALKAERELDQARKEGYIPVSALLSDESAGALAAQLYARYCQTPMSGGLEAEIPVVRERWIDRAREDLQALTEHVGGAK